MARLVAHVLRAHVVKGMTSKIEARAVIGWSADVRWPVAALRRRFGLVVGPPAEQHKHTRKPDHHLTQPAPLEHHKHPRKPNCCFRPTIM
jgi:hypothetical protein